MNSIRSRIIPLLVVLPLIVLDQLTKMAVVANIPLHTIGWSWGGDFFYLVHQRNTGVAFSMGHNLPDYLRTTVFVILVVIVLVVLAVYYWRDKNLTILQRWSMALILSGGFGNVIDRIFRPEGVVDFLSFKFYGILGMERFATFNVADSCVTVGGALLILSMIISRKKS